MEIEFILDRKLDGDKLTSLEIHDIQCHIADAVLAGGIRRAAMISLFDLDDLDMINCKSGS
jgi:ribonucleoside-diphosphate reductase alpha chain